MPNDIRTTLLTAADRITHELDALELRQVVGMIEIAARRVSGGELTAAAMAEAADMFDGCRGGGRGDEFFITFVQALQSELGL
jgi:hypothetical protein